MKLRENQRQIVNNLKATTENRLVNAQTSFGKTVTFSFFAKEEIENSISDRVLIVVHREELLQQTVETLNKIEVFPQIINGKTKRIDHSKRIYVAMVGTIEARFKKYPNYIYGINTVITDECHRLDFLKVFEIFPEARRIGFTATPVITKKNDSLSNHYTAMIEAPSTAELVKEGSLVPEVAYHLPLKAEDFMKLKSSSSEGGFTSASMNSVFNQGLLIQQVFDYYEKYLKNKKTMIFCCSTQHMEETTAFFVDKGVNARSFGSKSESKRSEVVEWIRNTEDAVLISLDVFTAGFDVKDILGIILFRATTSLSLFLQMVGRGARTTEKVFKDFFTLIDFGNNIENFGLWSSPRDWESHFHNNKKAKEGIAPIRECKKCGRINHASATACDECGEEFPKKDLTFYEEDVEAKVVRVKDFKFSEVNVQKVKEFCEKKGWSIHKTVHLLLEANIRVLNVYDINADRFERDWREVVDRIWKVFRTQYKDLSAISDGKIKQSHHNLKYWKGQLLDKICEYYNREEMVLKGFGTYKNKSLN